MSTGICVIMCFVCKLFDNVRAKNGANVWSLLLVAVSWFVSHQSPSS